MAAPVPVMVNSEPRATPDSVSMPSLRAWRSNIGAIGARDSEAAFCINVSSSFRL